MSFSKIFRNSSSTPNTVYTTVPPVDHQERTLADFDLFKTLKISPGSTTFMGRDQRSGKIVTIKVVAKMGRDEDDFTFLLSEQRVLRSVTEKESLSFLPLLCSWHDSINFYLVTEYHAGGDLGFECMRSSKMDEDRARFYAAEIVVALEELERRNIVHRDIKPGNIVITAEGHLRIIDFGYAVQLPMPEVPADFDFDVDANSDSGSFLQNLGAPPMLKGSCGTPYFKCPEELRGQGYDFKKDVFGSGVSFHYMLLNRMPFGNGLDVRERAAIEASIVHEPLRFRQDDNISPEAKDLIKGMLAKDPRDRLSVQEIKQHPWFAGIDWKKAANHELPAPWKPFIPPVPKLGMPTRPVQKGRTLDKWDDFVPEFKFTSALLDPPQEKAPVPEAEEKPVKKGIFGFKVTRADKENVPVKVEVYCDKKVDTARDTGIEFPLNPVAQDKDIKPRSLFKSKPRVADTKAEEPFKYEKLAPVKHDKSFFTTLFCSSKKTKELTPEPFIGPKPESESLEKQDAAYWAAHIEAAFGPASLSDSRQAKRESLRPLRLPDLVASRSPSPSPSPTLCSPSPPPLLWDAKLFEPRNISQEDRDRIYGVPAEFRTDFKSKVKRAFSWLIPQQRPTEPEPEPEARDYSYYVNNPRRGVVHGPHYRSTDVLKPRKLGIVGHVRVALRRAGIRCAMAISRVLVCLGPGPIVESGSPDSYASSIGWCAHRYGYPVCY